MQKYYAYLARCSDKTLYAGYTVDVKRRELVHNEGDGARYTRMRRPVEIIYFEEFATRSEAMKREYALKQLDKQQKEQLLLLIHGKTI